MYFPQGTCLVYALHTSPAWPSPRHGRWLQCPRWLRASAHGRGSGPHDLTLKKWRDFTWFPQYLTEVHQRYPKMGIRDLILLIGHSLEFSLGVK